MNFPFLGSAMAYESERRVAVEAVLKACRLCQAVRAAPVSDETMAKEDLSPVTVADFGAQAVINLELKKAFVDDPIMAEEETTDLRTPPGAGLRAKVIAQVNSIVPGLTDAQIMGAIDRGAWRGGMTGRQWILDPIDGTKGYLRGEQYAIALALIEDGEVVLGVLGCPNLPADAGHPEGPRGCLFSAMKGRGAWMRLLGEPTEKRIGVTEITDPAMATFCESVEGSHSSHNRAARIAAILGVTNPPLRIDSQCKYAAVARGDVSIYLRLPTRVDYEEMIWDHAAGWIVVTEAGGKVSDVHGQALDFSRGRTLSGNTGVVATNGKLHPVVINVVRQILDSD